MSPRSRSKPGRAARRPVASSPSASLDPDALLRIAQESQRGVAPSPGLRSPAALAFRRKADAWRAAGLRRVGTRSDFAETARA